MKQSKVENKLNILYRQLESVEKQLDQMYEVMSTSHMIDKLELRKEELESEIRKYEEKKNVK